MHWAGEVGSNQTGTSSHRTKIHLANASCHRALGCTGMHWDVLGCKAEGRLEAVLPLLELGAVVPAQREVWIETPKRSQHTFLLPRLKPVKKDPAIFFSDSARPFRLGLFFISFLRSLKKHLKSEQNPFLFNLPGVFLSD